MDSHDIAAANANRAYICAPVNALVEGLYEEKIPFTQIKKHGDFGLGTFDHLDGEMVMLDGQIYHIAGTGQVDRVGEKAWTPFACVTFFHASHHERLETEVSYADFQVWLQRLLPSPNVFYALRIDGHFSHLKVRSVPRQENYRPLVEVTQDEPIFSYSNIEGTLAGFFTPDFLSSVSVPGLHLHFLSADKTRGGHVLECRPREVDAGVQMLSTLELALPMTRDYLTHDFHRNTDADLHKAEE